MKTLMEALEAFDKQKSFFRRGSDSWQNVEYRLREFSEGFGGRMSMEQLEESRRKLLESCQYYLLTHDNVKEKSKRYEAVRELEEQIRFLQPGHYYAGAENKVNLREYAKNRTVYDNKYQANIIGYRNESESEIKKSLLARQTSLTEEEKKILTEYKVDINEAINEKNVKAEVKKLDDYRRLCRKIMEEGRKNWDYELESYGRSLYQAVAESPLDNLRDLGLVRELEKEGKTFGDTESYKTPEINITLASTNIIGAGASVRYSGIDLNGTKGILTPFRTVYQNSIDNKIGELIHRNDLSRESIRVLNWIRDQKRLNTNDNLKLAVEGRGATQRFGTETIKAVLDELEQKKIFSQWEKDNESINTFWQYMGEGGDVYESGFIEKRNVAMSRMAELLGIGDVLARSRTVIYTDENGKRNKGCFMDFAEGMEIREPREDQKEDLLAAKEITMGPGGLKQIERLLVLDTICAQLDRHFGNVFVQYKMSDQGKLTITGVQGIDNDEAFVSRYHEDDLKKGKLLDNFRGREDILEATDGNSLFLDETVAERIKNLTEDDLRFAVGDCISEKDLEALWDRTKRVKDLLDPTKSKDHIVILKDDEKDWEFKTDEKGEVVHRLAEQGAPDRETFIKNAQILKREMVRREPGAEVLRVETYLADNKDMLQKEKAAEESRQKVSFEKLAEEEKPAKRRNSFVQMKEEAKDKGAQVKREAPKAIIGKHR